MNTYWRLVGFAKPIEKYAIPYFFCTMLYAFFNTFTFALIIPVLQTLFGQPIEYVTQMPRAEATIGFVRDMIHYALYRFYGTGYGAMDVLVSLSVVVVFASLLSNTFRYLSQRIIETLRVRSLQKLRNKVYGNVIGLHTGFFSNERKGDIISKISSDMQVVQFCITNTMQVLFRDPFLTIGYLVLLVAISWQLTIFAVLFLPVSALIIGYIVKRLKRKATAAQETFADMVSLMDESFAGIKIIKAYNATEYIKDKFQALNRRFSKLTLRISRRQQLGSPMSEFMGVATIAVVLIYGGRLVMSGEGLDAAAFIAYIGVFSQITRPVRSFADAFGNINQGIAAGDRVFSLLDAQNQITDAPDAREMVEFSESIEFRDVRFSYGTREVIKGITFSIRKGETVALVGPSGGGKSTISDLIPRFYDVQAGQILIDGIDIRDYSISSLRSHIAVVAQETILFNDTIEANIQMGDRGASHQQVVEAARVANADGFITQTDNGYLDNIGDRGMKLSGGQRQRLSIARAVLKNPDILILDEATSALDTESETLVQAALESLLKGRTSLVIAHRLSTIHNADRIIVIEDGRIVEEGNHNQLMAKDGLYAKLIEMQHMS